MFSLPEDQKPHSALLIIDVQPDFIPGGALACENGDELITPIDQLLLSQQFAHTVATQDWHPKDHISFVDQHPGHPPFSTIPLYGHEQVLWPPHCIQNTPGAELHPKIDWANVDLVLRKGRDRAVDSYSAFQHNPGPGGNRPSTGLKGWLEDQGITDLYLCGLARDVCVLWSAQDAIKAGFNVHFLWSLTRPVTSENDEKTRKILTDLNIDIIE